MDALYEYPAQTSAGRQKFYHVPIGMGNMKDLETLDGGGPLNLCKNLQQGLDFRSILWYSIEYEN